MIGETFGDYASAPTGPHAPPALHTKTRDTLDDVVVIQLYHHENCDCS